jgi:hypothetical protein
MVTTQEDPETELAGMTTGTGMLTLTMGKVMTVVGATGLTVVGGAVVTVVGGGTVVVVGGTTTRHRTGKASHSCFRMWAIRARILTGQTQDRVGERATWARVGWTASADWTDTALTEIMTAAAAVAYRNLFMAPPVPKSSHSL